MKPVVVTVPFASPPRETFALVSDIPNAAKNISAITRIEMLTQGPVGQGTRWRETRLMMKKEASETMEIVAFDPPRGYDVTAASHGARYRTTIRVEAAGSGSQVTMSFSCEPVSFGAKLMSLFAPLMAGMMRKCIEADLRELAAIAAARKG